MKTSEDFPFWYDKILRFLSLRPRSRQEIVDYLLRKKVNQEVSQQIIIRCEAENLINDTEFTRWFVEQRNTFRPKGKRAVRGELIQKGIDREIIDDVLITDLGSDEEQQAAQRITAKKLRLWRELPPKEKKSKVAAFLTRRGFDWSVIEKILAGIDS